MYSVHSRNINFAVYKFEHTRHNPKYRNRGLWYGK